MVHELPEDDPIVQHLIEDALLAYGDALSPEALEDARELVTLYVTTHPEMVAMVGSLLPRPAVASSGEVARLDERALEAPRKLGGLAGGSR